MNRQTYLYPYDLFTSGVLSDLKTWTCVRSRPRWEKKFAAWAAGQRLPHFLPVYARETISHRKRRIAELPLFPGYVFVAGNYDKGAFSRAGSVAYLLKPRSPHEAEELSLQLLHVWRGLEQGTHPTPARGIDPGEDVEIVSGPLMGTQGRLLRRGGDMSLILWVNMLGTGVEVRIGQDADVRRLD